MQRSRATLDAASAQLDGVEERLLRGEARESREQQAIDREAAATERLAVRGAGRLPEPDGRLAKLRARFLAAGADLARTADEVTAHYDRLLQEQPHNDMYRRRVKKAREAARSAHDAVRRLGGGEHRTP